VSREISCQEASRYVFRYLDGELEPATEAELEHHLEQCRQCMGAVEFERRVIEFVRSAATDRAPEDLRDRITRILGGETISGDR